MSKLCSAFRLDELTPCKSPRIPGLDVCHGHRTFYDKEIWKSRFLSIQNRRNLLQGINYPETTHIGRIQHVLGFSLKSGKIVLTEEDVAAMESIPAVQWNEPHNDFTDVFTVLCGTGKVLPKWNLRILRHTIYKYLKMHYNPGLIDVCPSMESRLGPFLANPSTSPSVIFRFAADFYENMYHKEDYTDDPEIISLWREYTNLNLVRFFKHALALKSMKSHLLLSDKEVASYFTPTTKRRVAILKPETVMRPYLMEFRKAEMMEHKARVTLFKEGIAAAVWHPTNIERWLDLGGWDMIAMMTGDDGLRD